VTLELCHITTKLPGITEKFSGWAKLRHI